MLIGHNTWVSGVLMALLCTLATAAAPNALSLYRSLMLRRPPPSAASRSVAIMNNRQDHYISTTSITTNTNTTTDLDAISKQKKALRSRVRKELKNMDPSLRSQEDNAIQNNISEAPWFKTCNRLCAYISCSALREVDTSNILSEILQNPAKGKKLYVPRVEDKNRNMRMLNISSIHDLVANSMNILEPAPVDAEGNKLEDVMQANDPVDLLLLPGLAFDKSGRRLGRGGGYYDTFLMNYQELARERKWKQPLLALSYSVQIMDEGVIPVTSTDVLVDAVVTPSGVIPINPAAMERCH